MRIYLFCLLLSFIFIQESTAQNDSLDRVGFSSLFTVVSANNNSATDQLQYQLNPKAVSFIQTYMEKQGPGLQKMKTWAKPYFNLYDQILVANGVPTTLKYLSVIESSLDAGVVSWAGAVGPWQIMPEEAKRLGLKLSPIDERTDYEKSTKAAAIILRESFAEFGDWLLVVAAYNGGAGRVRQAIQKKGSKDFWDIQYALPLETRNHVKKFIATQYVFETEHFQSLNQKEGLVKMTKEQKNHIEKQFDTIVIIGRYSLECVATALNLEINQLRQDNPGFNKVLATGKSFELKLPKGMLEKFEAHKNEILQASLNALYQYN